MAEIVKGADVAAKLKKNITEIACATSSSITSGTAQPPKPARTVATARQDLNASTSRLMRRKSFPVSIACASALA